MDILGFNVTSISLIELFKLLLTVLDALAGGGTRAPQYGNTANNEYSVNCGKNSALFAGDLYGKTLNFLKSNFKLEDLTQINDKINWGNLKQEPPKHSPNRSHSW